jgi:hypothetical protein
VGRKVVEWSKGDKEFIKRAGFVLMAELVIHDKKARDTEFMKFLDTTKEMGLTREMHVTWSTCFQNVNPTQNWFDPKKESWTFSWDDWVEEIVSEGTELPYTLVDPESFTNHADYIDVFIIKELEKNAARQELLLRCRLQLPGTLRSGKSGNGRCCCLRHPRIATPQQADSVLSTQ